MNFAVNKFIKKHNQPFLLLCVELFFIVFSIHIKGFSGVLTLRNLAMGSFIAVYVIMFFGRRLPVQSTKSIDNAWVYGMAGFLLWSFFVTMLNYAPFYGGQLSIVN